MTTANPACRRYLKKLSLGFAVYAATLMRSGLPPLVACRAALAEPLSDELDTVEALMEVVRAHFG